jgi:NAD(P)-dependent dehydrogenase (short-subunit alcohol dehydrogenase family)
MTASNRQKVLITGAAGGMGRACARLIGLTHDLVLNDVAAPGLEAFAAELERDGYTVSGVAAGDGCDDTVLAKLVGFLDKGQPFAVIHTAGVSPSQGDWQTIMRVNMLGTAKLMEVLEPLVVPGTVAVLIASTAGHIFPYLLEADPVMLAALEPDLVGRMTPFIDGMTAQAGPAAAGGIAYSLSKRGVLRFGERKAMAWGPKGGRVVTISPGLMLTPMGRQELANTKGAKETMDAAPVGRPGTAMDIAMVARFLLSPEASFISGSDIRVDGGSVSAMIAGAPKAG